MADPETPEPEPQRPAAPRRPSRDRREESGCGKSALIALGSALALLALVFVFILAVCSSK
jgi:hypothetical protein